MQRQKVFIYLTRESDTGPELLVLRSHDEPGYEVPKGSVEPRETLEAAVARELQEESGIRTTAQPESLGATQWKDEEQHFFHLRATDPIPDRFAHRVCSQDEDHGFLYEFCWLPLDKHLSKRLVQGCNRFLPALRSML